MTKQKLATVLGVSTHTVDLSDGRMVAPGEEVVDVDTDDAHNRDLVLDGHIIVLEGMTPRTRAEGHEEPPPPAPTVPADPDAQEG